MMLFKRLLILLCLAFPASQLLAEGRRALVIGNDAYPGNSLTNARNDATGVYDALKNAGYATTLVLDADRATLSRKVDDFVETLHPGDTAILYYAGHGMQVDGENFLIPVDFHLTTTDSAKAQAYSLSSVLERLTSHGAATQIVILDACRDNPFLGSRTMRGGWAGLGTSAGAFLAFGTSPGSTASDDPGEGHGLFTKSLLRYFTTSDLDIEEMFRKVRENVIRDSAGKQVPWVSSSLIGSFHVRPELDAKQAQSSLPSFGTGEAVENARSIQGLGESVGGTQIQERYPAAFSVPSLEEVRSLGVAADYARGAKWDAALGVLKNVLSIDPRCAVALRLIGLILHATGRDVEAVTTFTRALQIDPTDARAIAYRCAAEGLIDARSAEADCSRDLKEQPSADGYLALAGTQVALGAKDRAFASATHSISMGGPDLAYALRGAISAQERQDAQAERDFSKASQSAIQSDRY